MQETNPMRPHGAACRWGKPSAAPNVPWKVRYADSDSEEYVQTLAGVPTELKAVFEMAQKAKRQTCLGRARVDDTAELPRCQMQRKLAEWR